MVVVKVASWEVQIRCGGVRWIIRGWSSFFFIFLNGGVVLNGVPGVPTHPAQVSAHRFA